MAALCCVVAACGGAIDARSDEGPPAGPAAIADPGARDGAPAPAPRDGADDPSAVAPAGLGDGFCTPGDVTRGLYDPDCVYVLGTTLPATSGKEALFHPSAPGRIATGWGVPFFRPVVRGDQRILFTSMDPPGVFAFTPREQGPSATSSRLPAPACEGSVSIDLVLHPRSGTGGPAGYYGCLKGSQRLYFEIGTSTVLDVGGRRLLGIDASGVALVDPGEGKSLVDALGERAVTGLEGVAPVAVRARAGGGLLVAATTGGLRRVPHLYELDVATGVAVDCGAYPMGSLELLGETALEPSGALEAIVTLSPPSSYGVVRLRLEAPPEVLFDERANAVKLHGAKLVTGP